MPAALPYDGVGRTCRKCACYKTSEHFAITSRGRLDSYCRTCRARIGRAIYARRRGRNHGWGNAVYRRNAMYNIDFEALLEAQHGLCAACHRPMERTGKGPLAVVVDHDRACCGRNRSCGRCVRGLLHSACNLVLGNAGDDVELLLDLAAYIKTWRAHSHGT